MNKMTERSMMWRTTYTFGAFGLALALAYVGFLLGGDPTHTIAFRTVAAGVLTAAACVCVMTALREMRAAKSKRALEAPQPGTAGARRA